MRISLRSLWLRIGGPLLLAGGAFWGAYSWDREDPDAGCIMLRRPDPVIAGIVAALSQDLPLDRPLEVRREPLRVWGLLGLTMVEGDQYVIVLDDSLTPVEALDVLLHEYAHALTWDEDGEDGDDREDHGPAWGEAYSRTYLAWLK